MNRLVCVLLVLGGCLYDEKPPVCNYGIAKEPPAQEFRDPQTGVCQPFGGGGCGNGCGPCAQGAAIAVPDWGACAGKCDALAEQACLAEPGCHAAYQHHTNNPSDTTPPTFWGCWEVAASGPIEGGGCAGLDAQTCSRHDDCIEIYSTVNEPPPGTGFESCAAEPAQTCSNLTCATGTECVEHPGATPGAECVDPAKAGACTGSVVCNLGPPACPTGTTAGIANGCYSGYCIPNNECPPAACSTLTTETACKARPDCDTVYQGSNCTCDNSGCTCQTETFLRCQ